MPVGRYAHRVLHVSAHTNAARQVWLWRDVDAEGVRAMEYIARQPVASWLGEWSGDVALTVSRIFEEAAGALPVFVLYMIPGRDCGGFSAGGCPDEGSYLDFVDALARGLRGREALLVLEPDALALASRLSEADLHERVALLAAASRRLSAAGARVYVDAGDACWVPAAEMAVRLLAVGVGSSIGFALNVSHTDTTEDCVLYAEAIRAIVGDAAYVVDTSRNGVGPTPGREWCNPAGRALGAPPTLETGVPGLDALLWVKPPGESDGPRHGGPPAGAWWPAYARALAWNSRLFVRHNP